MPSVDEDARRRKRMSEPPRRVTQESWEYPLSREEKKYRVMCLFEQELAEAKQSGEEEEQAMEELYTQLERIEELRPGTAKRLKEAVRSIGLTSLEGATAAAARRSWMRILCLAIFVALLILGLYLLTFRAGTPALAETPSECAASALAEAASERPPLPEAQEGPERATSTTTTEAAVTLETVARQRRLGLQNLRRSDCFQAAYYFGRALDLLPQVLADEAELRKGELQLLGDQAFALICSKRFAEGAKLLEGCVAGETDCSSHLLNALGYAQFMQQDYTRAAETFQLGTSADPQNPIIWSNLGAAQMELWHLDAADEALFKAADLSQSNELVVHNVKELKQRAGTSQISSRALVDLWFGEEKTF